MVRGVFLLVMAWILALGAAHSAQVTASFSHLSGATWTVDFTVTNDGAPDLITGFTVYFSESLFADLVVSASPPEWDSIVIQPDLVLESPGFFDTFVLAPGAPLILGASQSGFSAQFKLLGDAVPPMLFFDIVDQEFNVLFSGVTTPQIPEPAIVVMLIIGLGVVETAVRRRSAQPDCQAIV